MRCLKQSQCFDTPSQVVFLIDKPNVGFFFQIDGHTCNVLEKDKSHKFKHTDTTQAVGY